MKAFRFDRPRTLEAAARALAEGGAVRLKAGGTDLLDRMKERVDEPDRVVGLVDVDAQARGVRLEGDTLVVGALVTLEDLATSGVVRQAAPSLAEAAAEAGSPAIRHVATIAGNLLQHPRCGYYRLRSFPCLRRGDAACPVRADGGVQDRAGIFANEACAAAHPSSLAPVLAALDAFVRWTGTDGAAQGRIRDRWLAPARGRAEDFDLPAGAVVTSFAVPRQDLGTDARDAYVEVRQRAAFDWALVTAAVRLVRHEDRVGEAAIWLGAVAPRPWRAAAAEAAIGEKPWSAATLAAAADAASEGATPLEGTRYKVPLVRVAVRRALEKAWGRSR